VSIESLFEAVAPGLSINHHELPLWGKDIRSRRRTGR